MQVVSPIDIEDALRSDLGAAMSGCRVFAPPIPADLAASDVLVEVVGGMSASAASNEHDVSVDCYAGNEAEACALANEACGIVASLPLRDTDTQYGAVSINAVPYRNHDPRAPQLARYTFRAHIVCPGERLTF